MSTGAELIAAERARQVEVEGWTPEHDDEHNQAELVGAGTSYALYARWLLLGKPDFRLTISPMVFWPSWWDQNWWKPSDDPVRNLVKAGALIAAEIDRLQRTKEETS